MLLLCVQVGGDWCFELPHPTSYRLVTFIWPVSIITFNDASREPSSLTELPLRHSPWLTPTTNGVLPIIGKDVRWAFHYLTGEPPNICTLSDRCKYIAIASIIAVNIIDALLPVFRFNHFKSDPFLGMSISRNHTHYCTGGLTSTSVWLVMTVQLEPQLCRHNMPHKLNSYTYYYTIDSWQPSFILTCNYDLLYYQHDRDLHWVILG